jgi:hypothetical protein
MIAGIIDTITTIVGGRNAMSETAIAMLKPSRRYFVPKLTVDVASASFFPV